MPKVSINLVTHHSLEYLPGCLNSIQKQTYRDFAILVIDNHSTDATLEYLKKNWPAIKIIKNEQNLYFSKAHNQGIEASSAEYILVANPDIVLADDCLEQLVKTLDHDASLASVGPKLLRLNDLKAGSEFDMIDAAGLKALRNRQFINRGEGEEDRGQYNQAQEVFGNSAALVLYRRKALAEVKINQEYFDEDLAFYKEDIDLAWRLILYGWSNFYNFRAVAYHRREAVKDSSPDGFKLKETRKRRSALVNYYSYRNQFLILIKNELASNLFWWFPYIGWFEFKKIIFLILFEQSTLKALAGAIRLKPKFLKKRRIIMKNKKVGQAEIRQWFK